jgi:hypothetical protein
MHQFCATHAMSYMTSADLCGDTPSKYIRFCGAAMLMRFTRNLAASGSRSNHKTSTWLTKEKPDARSSRYQNW